MANSNVGYKVGDDLKEAVNNFLKLKDAVRDYLKEFDAKEPDYAIRCALIQRLRELVKEE